MDNDESLPDVMSDDWDRHQVAALFDDLENGAQVERVQVRTASSSGRQDRAVTLREAQALLDDESLRAVQIRYEFDGQHWCDTLMCNPTSVRMIRTRIEK